MPSLLKRLFLATIGRLVKWMYRAIMLLHLGVLLLERGSAHDAGGADAEQRRAQQQLLSGTAWREFCASVQGLGEVALSAPASGRMQYDELDRVEAYRYLTRLMRAGLEGFVEGYDSAWPMLRPLPYNVKIGADNPDNLYMFASVSGDFQYRLSGSRGSVTYLSFAVYSGAHPGQGSTAPAHLDSGSLLVKADSSFEVMLSAQPCGDNWLPLAADATRVVVRQTFLDRGTEAAAQLHLERLAPQGLVRPTLQATQVVSGLAGAALLAAGSAMQFNRWVALFADEYHNTLRSLEFDQYMTAWADPSITFFHGYWAVGEDEALLVLLDPPPCCYWNFQLNNIWMESLADDERGSSGGSGRSCGSTSASTATAAPGGAQPGEEVALSARVGVDATTQSGGGVTHINKRTARVRSDGRVALVVARQAPPSPLLQQHCAQWVSTAAHRHGTMALRWVLAEAQSLPSCQLLPLTELGAALGAI